MIAGSVSRPRRPARPILKSLASPGLLAHITVSKYQDALPLYRQEIILQRIGVDIPPATLANWMIKAGALIQPIINLLRDRLQEYDIVQMGETTVQVLNSHSVAGVKASANLCSLIETAKANGLEPYAYLRHLYTYLPRAASVEDIEVLLPGNIDSQYLGA